MLLSFDAFEIDDTRFELRHDGEPVPVEPLVFDLILYLARNADRVVGRQEIVEHVWQGRIVSDATISGCLKSARRALGDDGKTQERIRTVRGRGFYFVGGERPDAPPAPLPVMPERPAERPVIAVMPFENLGGGLEEYFSDGLAEDLITSLSRFRELQVIARTSTFRFRGQDLDLTLLRAELNPHYVVEGSVRRRGGRVRLSVRLIDAGTGTHVWADNFDHELEDILLLQDELVRTVAAILGVQVQDVGLQKSLSKGPAELNAYDLVLRARRYTRTLLAPDHAEARDLLEAAIVQDPNSSDAHALLCNVYLAEYRFELNPRPDPILRALAMAQRATELDPQNAYARLWLAITHFFRHENDLFHAEAERALLLNPNDPEILADAGHYYAFMGEFERGIELSGQARRLNPFHPSWYHFSFARYHFARRDYAKALTDLARIDMPEFYWTHILGAAALGQLGDSEAGTALGRVFELLPDCDIRQQLQHWNAAPDDLEHLMEGIDKASQPSQTPRKS